MTNLSKEELVRLAELAGYDYRQVNREWLYKLSPLRKPLQKRLRFDSWQPDKDIQQAMEVLRTFCKSKGYGYGLFENQDAEKDQVTTLCEIHAKDRWFESRNYDDTTIELTICRTILKAMEEG